METLQETKLESNSEEEPTLDAVDSVIPIILAKKKVSSEKCIVIKRNEDNIERTVAKELIKKLWPPIGQLNFIICFICCALFIYMSLLAVFERRFFAPFSDMSANSSNIVTDSVGNMTDSVLALFFLLLIACIIGWFVDMTQLPALLGMLVVGILARNVAGFKLALLINHKWSTALRRFAFVVILLQGGLSLDASALKRLKGACLRLAALPCLFEAVTIMFASNWFIGLSLQHGLMLGFVLGAVSPAVCVPGMLSLSQKGYGIEAGVPTLVIAASSVDDVLAITAFSVVLALAFAHGNVSMIVMRGPFEVFIGAFAGISLGLMCWFFPDFNQQHRTILRLTLLISGAIACMFGSSAVEMDGAGPIACFIAAFVAALGWNHMAIKQGLQNMSKSEEVSVLSLLWDLLFQPLLFSLIGAELDISKIGLDRIWLELLTLCIGLIVRIFTAFASVSYAGFNTLEKIFVAFAWLPKATVQAALGPVAYDLAVEKKFDVEYEEAGMTILTVAVLSILVTAPLGSILLKLTGPHLLKKQRKHTAEEATELVGEYSKNV